MGTVHAANGRAEVCSLGWQVALTMLTDENWRCRMQGRYDRIHVGASCPLEHLGRLTALLGPEGGCIVTPVAPSDLRLISVSPTGVTTQRVLSQVRYGELEVRRDSSGRIASGIATLGASGVSARLWFIGRHEQVGE